MSYEEGSPRQDVEPELEITARVLRDERFREALLSEPEATLEREYGLKLPQGVSIQVHEETDNLMHFIVPGRPHRFERLLEGDFNDTVLERMRGGEAKCCTCGSSTSQTLSSLQSC